MKRFTAISGCSGGGKSTLLAELERRGFAVVEEPGRRIVAEELATGGSALPWVDLEGFARRALALSRADHAKALGMPGRVFFDRGVVDAAAVLDALGRDGEPGAVLHACRYDARVFLTPPWPEIYAPDAERRHDLAAAVAEYERLLRYYPAQGYETVILPKVSVEERAGFVLDALAAG